MQASNYFLSKVKQAQKHKQSHPDFDLEQSIADFFVKIVALPEPMARELYDSHALSHESLALVIDFFHNELELADASHFSSDQWQEMLELINRYAKKDDIDNLQEIMQFLLDIGEL